MSTILQTYSTNLAVATGDTIALNNNPVITTSTVERTSATVITIKHSGVYRVSVNTTGTTTAAGAFGVQLMVNNAAAVDAFAKTTTANAGDTTSVSFETLLGVVNANNGIASIPISLQYTGVAGTILVANVIIVKIA